MSQTCDRCWHNHIHANGLECYCRCHSECDYATCGTATSRFFLTSQLTEAKTQ